MNNTSISSVVELPKGWRWIPLFELRNKADRYSFTGGPFGSDLKSEDYTESGARVIQLQNIGEGFFLEKSKVYTSEAKADALIACNIYPGEIILAKMAPVARCCKIPASSGRYLMCSDGIRLSVDRNRFDNEFIYQALNTDYFRNSAESKSTGTTRARIGLNDLKTIPVAIPESIDEQRKIAEILSTLDEKMAVIDEQLAQTQELKRGLMQRLLTRGGGHTEFKDSPLGQIPVGWEVKSLNSVSNVVRGASPRPAGNPLYFGGDFLPWITVASVTRTEGVYLKKEDVKAFLTEKGAEQTRVLQPDTVIMSNSGATLGVPKILTFVGGANDGVAAFLNLIGVSKRFLYYFLDSKTTFFRNELAPGSGQPNLNTSLIGNLLMPLPPLAEQRQIAEILTTVDDKIGVLEQKKAQYKTLKRGLMQQLLTGQRRVRVVPTEAILA